MNKFRRLAAKTRRTTAFSYNESYIEVFYGLYRKLNRINNGLNTLRFTDKNYLPNSKYNFKLLKKE